MLPAEKGRGLRLVPLERFLLGVPTEPPARPVRDVADEAHDRRTVPDLGGGDRRSSALDAFDEVPDQQVRRVAALHYLALRAIDRLGPRSVAPGGALGRLHLGVDLIADAV